MLNLPNPMNLPMMPMTTAGPTEAPQAMPMAPSSNVNMGIAGGVPGGQVNPTGQTNSTRSSGTGPSKQKGSRGAPDAIKAQNNVNNAIKSASLILPLTKQAFIKKVVQPVLETAEGLGHNLLDEVDKHKKTQQTNEHRATPPQQSRLA